MEMALYDKSDGYYASGRAVIGKTGDFFTNVSVGKIYGKILALCFEELWEKMGRPNGFTIIEQGANDGVLALDILEATKTSSDFFSTLRYGIVEPFSVYQKKQRENLKTYSNTFWAETIEDLPSFQGIHFSNELLDAFPVDLLTWDGKEWLEQRVSENEEGNHSWITTPIKAKELLAIAEKLPTTLSPGFLWEVRLGVAPWLQQLSTKLQRGIVLIADYGYAGPQRFAPYRSGGSIACYQHHQRFNNPLEEIGKRDITTHVDFTDLANQARQQDFEILGYSDQHHFLIGAAETWLRSFEGRALTTAEQKEFRLLQTLLHPETMGRSFQFLGLGKNLKIDSLISGFRYQRPGSNYLLAS